MRLGLYTTQRYLCQAITGKLALAHRHSADNADVITRTCGRRVSIVERSLLLGEVFIICSIKAFKLNKASFLVFRVVWVEWGIANLARYVAIATRKVCEVRAVFIAILHDIARELIIVEHVL